MSDFGARIYINKKSAEAFTEKELEEIAIFCEGLKKETRLTNSLGDPYLFHVGKTLKELCLFMSPCRQALHQVVSHG